MSKHCNKCNITKALEDFYKRRRSKLGVSDYCKDCCKNYENENKDRFKARKLKNFKDYCKNNKDKHNTNRKMYYHEVLKNRPNHILAKNLRTRLYHKIKDKSSIVNLGCSISEFKLYIENQFQSGMTWNNYGEWHIDHVIPLSKFNLTSETELKEACNYLNLQPLWAKDNIRKSNHV